MSNTTTPPSKQDVYDALSELKKGRSRGRAYVAIKGILYRYGDGVKHISDLDPEYYAAVIAAVTIPTVPTAADIYGTVTDVAPPQRKPAPAPPVSTRPLTPLVADLECKLKERAGKPRSRPNFAVNIGNPAQPGDEAAPLHYPSDGRKVS